MARKISEYPANDYAAFRDGVCVAIQSVMDERSNRAFYREYVGCEIRIMTREAACDALRAAIRPVEGK